MTTIDRTRLDEFTRAYAECAIWSSTDDDGEPLDRDYDLRSIAEDTLTTMMEDCRDFQASFGDYILEDLSRAGHDFWLTRNGHGAGFWDGDWDGPYPNASESPTWTTKYVPRYATVGDFLTAMSKPYGEFNLYVGDDGLIHGM